jgi:Na+-transporting methylmalonyl-CoA/oxaloacetate decarboxylase gamma subunit
MWVGTHKNGYGTQEVGIMGKRLMFAVLVGLVLVMTACAAVIDSEGAKIGDPKRFAEATHIAEMSEAASQATATAVSLQTTRTAAEISAQATRTVADITARETAEAIANEKRQSEAGQVGAQATVALAKAKTEVEAQPAEARGKATAYLLSWAGLGAGVLVLAVGLAFGVVAWVNKRATVIYPNAQGQFPLVPERGPGYTVYHDPNRALGPGTIINRPGIADRLTHVILLARGREKPQTPGAVYPETASEGAMLQIGTGAQLVQNEVAKQSGRPKLLFGTMQPPGLQLSSDRGQARHGRMPRVAVINDPKEIEHFERRLLSGGDDE